MATIAISDLNLVEADNEMLVLTDTEQISVYGGWIGPALAAVGIGLTAYGLMTTQEERMRHRRMVANGGRRLLRQAGRRVVIV